MESMSHHAERKSTATDWRWIIHLQSLSKPIFQYLSFLQAKRSLVLLAALVLGDLVAAGISVLVIHPFSQLTTPSIQKHTVPRAEYYRDGRWKRKRGGRVLHMVRQLLDVGLLLGELLAQLLELLLLALADGVVLAGALASLEGVAMGVTLVIGWVMTCVLGCFVVG